MNASIRLPTVGPTPTFSPRRFQSIVTSDARLERWKMLSAWPIVTAQFCAIDDRLLSTVRVPRPLDARSWLIAATNCELSLEAAEICCSGVAAAHPADSGEATDQTAANPATINVVEKVVISARTFTEASSVVLP
jgi:hypothetical protein